MKDLHVAGWQGAIHWSDISVNLAEWEARWAKAPKADLYLLPETFATGFVTRTEELATVASGSDGGAPAAALKRWAVSAQAWVGGTVFVREENGRYRNRFFLAGPSGEVHIYDKRHLFGIAGEAEHFDGGNERVVITVQGWRLLLAVCYDLRFPVWLRQTPGEKPYDGLLIPANWPEARQNAWDTLLRARAMENQCYVLGVNRLGEDGFGVHHAGGTASIGPWGDVLATGERGQSGWVTSTWEAVHLAAVRKRYPFLGDADPFTLG